MGKFMCALGKYYEDNLRIAEERKSSKEATFDVPSENSKKQVDIFAPKKGELGLKKSPFRTGFYLTMTFHQYLYPEWISVLKDKGWRWNSKEHYWYVQYYGCTYNFAYEFIYGEKPPKLLPFDAPYRANFLPDTDDDIYNE